MEPKSLQIDYPSTGLASQNAEHSSVPHLSKITVFICTELGICIEMLPQNATHVIAEALLPQVIL